jgi:hypothetical protein
MHGSERPPCVSFTRIERAPARVAEQDPRTIVRPAVRAFRRAL